RCSACGAEYGPQEPRYLCPRDGGCLEVVLDLRRARGELAAAGVAPGAPAGEPSHWRYLPLLPVGDPGGQGTPFRAVGATPLYSVPDLRARLGLLRLWVKDEGRNPTASLKDRASSLVLARAREVGAEVVVTSSTGNAGAALAGMAACLGVPAVILAPRSAPPAKIAQMLVYGARVLLVDGSYDQATELARRASEELGWFCRNTGYNPFSAEGKKTAAFEIWEAWQRGELGEAGGAEMRLSVFVPVGDGNIIAGLDKGFRDLVQAGLLERGPRLFGVQAEGSAAIASAFAAGTETIRAVRARTLADSIAVDLPADGLRALRAASRTGGAYLTVSDAAILQSIAELGRSGLFAEPAAAAAWAGLRRALAQGLVNAGEPVLVLLTGSGLKDVGAAQRATAAAPVIEPSLEALRACLAKSSPQ
ncbi:MAG: threonine synthase, partial [Spirochaetes bacterium RBG_16_67_19]